MTCKIVWFFFTSDKIALNGAREKHSLPFSSVRVSPKEETSRIYHSHLLPKNLFPFLLLDCC